MFENRLLRNMFGPKKEEVAGDWRKLHNEELLLLAQCHWDGQFKVN
jgi:hypothetical protein